MNRQHYFQEMKQIYSISKTDRRKTINLDLNENLFGCAPEVIDAIKQIDSSVISSYPQAFEFEQQYADSIGLEPDQVLATNGADAGIELIIKSLNRDIEIVTVSPTFKMYEITAGWYGHSVIRVDYQSLDAFPLKKVIKEMKKSGRMLFLANPDSPVGGWLSPDSIATLARESMPNPVVIDETYYQFAGETAVSLIAQHPNLIFLHSFSKAYGLAGLRLGTVIAVKETITLLRKWIKPFETNQIALLAGLTTLESSSYLDSLIRRVKQSKEKLSLAIKAAGFDVINSNANFILIRAGIWAPDIVRKLAGRNFQVKLIQHPPLLDGFIRVAAMPNPILDDFITTFNDILEEIWRNSRTKFPRH
ncbi:MAG: histidinol-phosphate transaminase [Calditrichia bacterium]